MKILLSFLLLLSSYCIAQPLQPTNCTNLPQLSGRLINYSFITVPVINTYPESQMCFYLDVDGQWVNYHSWNGGTLWYAQPAAINETQITEIMRRVGEDWSAWKVNWTTDSTVFLAANPLRRMRIIVTPTNYWRPNVGGISYTGSFTWGEVESCAFVFSNMMGNDAQNIAECASHEAGHTAGLTHQSDYSPNCTLTNHYSAGNGFWATIMGNSYGRTQTTWNNGATPFGCNVTQDNVALMMQQNDFVWRDRTTENINLTSGVLRRTLSIQQYRTDSLRLHVNSPSLIQVRLISGGNTDVQAKINGQTYNSDSLSVVFSTTIQNGNTWLEVTGVDNAFSPSNYVSFGQVFMEIITTPLTTTPYYPTQPRPVTRTPNLSWDNNAIYFKATIPDEYALISMSSQVVAKGRYRVGTNTIDISRLPSGVYILKTFLNCYQIVKH
jgi:hypothetical protein